MISLRDDEIITKVKFTVGFMFVGHVAQYHIDVTTNAGSKGRLYSFYTDEKSYTEKQFVGMTVGQAKKKLFDDDVAYIRS